MAEPATTASDASESPSAAASPSEFKSIAQQAEELGFLHLVDDLGNFGCSEKGLVNLMKKAKRSPSATGYSIVSIMGCQSTGKSTLLNLLFGTRFHEMKIEEGRQQTTKGIWVDASNIDDIIVMDLEGTDSAERGEDRTTFERQTSLYALSLAEVLILNMLETDIGRYAASSHAILKTVIEVNLQIFQANSKTTLLFVIRDYFGNVAFEKLQSRLMDGINQVWKEIRKPEKFKDTPISELFNFEFCGLPDKRHRPEEFVDGVAKLRLRFTDKSAPNYFWKDIPSGAKAVPAESFGRYAHEIWETIRLNKELNLPSQKEMLATFRCDEVINGLTDSLHASLQGLRTEILPGIVAGLGAKMARVRTDTLKLFDEGTAQYQSEVVKRKRLELETKINKEFFSTLFVVQVGHLKRDAGKHFNGLLEQELSNRPEHEFYDVVDSCIKSTHELWNKIIHDSDVPECKWDSDVHLDELNGAIEEQVKSVRSARMNQLSGAGFDQRLKKLLSKTKPIYKEADEKMWHQLGAVQDKELNQFFTELGPTFEGYRATSDERYEIESKIKQRLRMEMKKTAASEAENLGQYMRARFDKTFKNDPTGVPRRWGVNDNLDGIWRESKENALKLIDLFATFNLPRPSVGMRNPNKPVAAAATGHRQSRLELAAQASAGAPLVDGVSPALLQKPRADSKDAVVEPLDTETPEERTLIDEETRRQLIEKEFEPYVAGAWAQARADQERASSGKIPLPLILALAYTGMDDVADALTSPVKLVFLILLAAGVWFLHQAGLLSPLLKKLAAAPTAIWSAVTEHTKQVQSKAHSPVPTRRSMKLDGVVPGDDASIAGGSPNGPRPVQRGASFRSARVANEDRAGLVQRQGSFRAAAPARPVAEADENDSSPIGVESVEAVVAEAADSKKDA